MKMINLMFLYKIDIFYIQEHNLKDHSKLEYLKKFCEVLINYSNCHKGGTAILINKGSNVDVLSWECDVNGHIVSAKCMYSNSTLQLVNVYAPSGSDKKSIREDLFQNDLLYFLRNNNQNLILGGDWNAITCKRDCSNIQSDLVSPALTRLMNNLKFKDTWFLTNHLVEYTFFRQNYGSRLDRLYVKDLQNSVSDTQNIPVSWSDHSMIKSTFRLDNVSRPGRGYWKLNCSILKQDVVIENFSERWEWLKSKKSKFNNILEWWNFVKAELKLFFIKSSKNISQEKYGLLNLLRFQLKDVITKYTSNPDDYQTMTMLKTKINAIQDNICEGVQIRAKLDEKMKGEKISSYLLSKEKSSRYRLDRIVTSDGNCVTNSQAISYYVKNYYENLFKKEECDLDAQDEFLHFISKIIGEKENELLTAEITECELLTTIQGMNNGKSPGIDGLPVEFYKGLWPVIKEELFNVVKYILSHEMLSSKMNKGIIALTPKDGDLECIANWRPITMLNVDYKIVAKIITNRVKPLLTKFISPEQVCCVNGRTIDANNILLRDVMYYANENKIEAALINLDWAKAFDRVDHDYLFRILFKLGFNIRFINWIKMLYIEAESSLCINGNISEPFSIKKSVRQGCPLSMILFIISQEPFFRMLKFRLSNYSLKLPNSLFLSIFGYADDSTVLVNDDRGIRECFAVIHKYEIGTGAKLNKSKTSIFGIGDWKERVTWPVLGLKQIKNNCKILGIIYDNDYHISVNMNWKSIEENITKCIGAFHSRKLTLFQKAILINCRILAKCWYISNVYPIPIEYAKRIQKIIFKYLWGGNYEPINRKTMYLPKCRGGCGIIDISCKSKAILFKTFLKVVLDTGHPDFKLMIYYCQVRATYLIDPHGYTEATIFMSPYYSELITILRLAIKTRTFPAVNVKSIYRVLMDNDKYQSRAELNYPLFNWKEIWENVFNVYIEIDSRVILYKYIHEILTTNERLYMLKISDDNKCLNCGELDSNMHLLYFCSLAKNLIEWFKILFFKLCKVKAKSFIQILRLDFKPCTTKDRNTAAVLIAEYVTGVWYGHKIGLLVDDPRLISFIRSRIIRNRWILSQMLPMESFSTKFTKEYIQMT